MRLIDADELIETMMSSRSYNDYEWGMYADDIKEIYIDLAPTIDRQQGKWIDDGTELGCCCSECGVTLDDYFDGALYAVRLAKIPIFCPNCGARMRGEQE